MGLPFPNLPDNIDLLGELIRGARAKFGERVVILVDEYDKPVLDNLHDNRHITRMTCCCCLMPPFSISKTIPVASRTASLVISVASRTASPVIPACFWRESSVFAYKSALLAI